MTIQFILTYCNNKFKYGYKIKEIYRISHNLLYFSIYFSHTRSYLLEIYSSVEKVNIEICNHLLLELYNTTLI